MSWIDVVIMVEEEEEVARELSIRKSIAERNALIAKGEYELEEGEEIE
jgi:RNA polymerase subunit RPABC4/transcription elongation factor Spt4